MSYLYNLDNMIENIADNNNVKTKQDLENFSIYMHSVLEKSIIAYSINNNIANYYSPLKFEEVK